MQENHRSKSTQSSYSKDWNVQDEATHLRMDQVWKKLEYLPNAANIDWWLLRRKISGWYALTRREYCSRQKIAIAYVMQAVMLSNLTAFKVIHSYPLEVPVFAFSL